MATLELQKLMRKNELGFSVTLTIIILLVGVLVVILLPITYRGDPVTELDFSPRYYELLNKSPLTEDERAEFLLEKCEGNKRMIEFVEKDGGKVLERVREEHEKECIKLQQITQVRASHGTAHKARGPLA